MLEIRNTFLVKRILVANLAVFALFSTYAQQQPLKTFSLKGCRRVCIAKQIGSEKCTTRHR
jgi:hypothetical protein